MTSLNGEKYRSRRWILANSILVWSRIFSIIVLILGMVTVRDDMSSIIVGVLAFLGGVHGLVYGAYTANRAYTDKSNE